MMEGKQVVEITPAALPDKSAALVHLMAEREVRGAVFLGDDLADAAAFREIRRRREATGVAGLSVAVADNETPPLVRESADLTIDGVGDVERFLTLLATRLE